MKTITFLKSKPFTQTVELDKIFSFRKDRKYHWIQKACFWILDKIDCKHVIKKDSVKYETVNIGNIFHQLQENIAEIHKNYNVKPGKLFIGREEYYELIKMACPSMMFSVVNQTNPDRNLFGLEVTVVPWMKGMVVLPERWERYVY